MAIKKRQRSQRYFIGINL